MKFNIDRLKEVARPASAEELKDAEYRKKNYDWLEKSALIALDIHTCGRIIYRSRSLPRCLMLHQPK